MGLSFDNSMIPQRGFTAFFLAVLLAVAFHVAPSTLAAEFACDSLSAGNVGGKTYWFYPPDNGSAEYPGFTGRGYSNLVLNANGTYTLNAANAAFTRSGNWTATNGLNGPFTWVDVWLSNFPETGERSVVVLFNTCGGELERIEPVFANVASFAFRVTDGAVPTPRPVANVSIHGGGGSWEVGSSPTLTVTADGDRPLTFAWKSAAGVLPWATGSTLTLTNIQFAQSGSYTVTVANAYGSLSASATLTVVNGTAPSITSQPFGMNKTVGEFAPFAVTAGGSFPLYYQWRKGGQPLPGQTNQSFNLLAVTLADAGNYDVWVSNRFGVVFSDVATLNVAAVEVPNPPVISFVSGSTNITTGSDVALTVTATGGTPLSYLWRKNGTPVVTGWTPETGNLYATNATFLQTNFLGLGLQAPYDVIVSNRWGAVTSAPSAWIHVFGTNKPFVSGGSGIVTQAVGSSVTFQFRSSDLPPFTWGVLRNGAPWTDPRATFTSGFTNDGFHETHFFVTLTGLTGGDTGLYQPWVSNRFGAFTNTFPYTLRVVSALPPAFFAQPRSQSVGIGGSAVLGASFEANPDGGTAGIEWYSNNVRVASQLGGSLNLGGLLINTNSYELPISSLGIVEVYAVATNTFGRTTSSVAQITGKLLPGSLDPAFAQTNVLSPALCTAILPLPDGSVLVGGRFTTINGLSRTKIAKFLPSGALDTAWTPAGNGITGVASSFVKRLVPLPGGKILAAGNVTAASGGFSYQGLFRLNADGSLDTTFGTSGASVVTGIAAGVDIMDLAVQTDGKILVAGGPLSSAAGIGLLRFNADGTPDTGFTSPVASASASAPVRTVALDANGKIWIGGGFTTVGGQSRRYLARLEANGALDTTVSNYAASAQVHLVRVQPDGRVLLGGAFSTLGGVAVRGLARLTADLAVETVDGFPSLPGFNASSTRFVDSILVRPDGGLLVGGSFSVSDADRSFLYGVKADGSVDDYPPLSVEPNADIHAMSLAADGSVWIAGYFSQLGATPVGGFARLTAGENPVVEAPAPELGEIVFAAGKFRFSLPTTAGRSYAIQFKPDLASAWTTVQTIVGDGTNKPVELPTDAPMGFYQVVLLP